MLHLLYARFWHKVLYDLGVVSTKEPFKRLVSQGMILGEVGMFARGSARGCRVALSSLFTLWQRLSWLYSSAEPWLFRWSTLFSRMLMADTLMKITPKRLQSGLITLTALSFGVVRECICAVCEPVGDNKLQMS